MNVEAIQSINSFSFEPKDLHLLSLDKTEGRSLFADLVLSKLDAVNNTVSASHNIVERYVTGEDVAVHDVMIAMGKAKSELQLMVEVRNKLLEAYQEIMRIQL
jgi:flagellar hook-basal body complex protein FliE